MIDLSSSTEPRVAVAGRVLARLAAVTARHGVPIMVIGATARDILAEAIVGRAPDRATVDVDVAVAVPSWEAYDALVATLERRGQAEHRFTVDGIPVDVVPFGALEDGDHRITWHDGARMNTLGLAEAYRASLLVRLPGGVEVRVPSPAGLAALKVIAWSDRRLETRRDAVDLHTIIGWYQSGTLLEELYNTELRLLEVHGFDPDLAAAHRLGRQMAEVLGDSRGQVRDILDDHLAQLVADMPASVLDLRAVLEALRSGMREDESR